MKTQIRQVGVEPEAVSALMDGQLGADELAAMLGELDAGEARERWHVYHLVGDVLRSTDLAACGHDADCARRVTERLKREAVVPTPAPSLAPAPIVVRDARRPAANDGVFRWKMVAGLASFAAVAAIGWGAMGSFGPRPGGAQLAQQGHAAPGTQVVTLVPQAAPVAPGELIEAAGMTRDPRLDELLAAHRQAVGASALASSAGFLRNATFEGPGR